MAQLARIRAVVEWRWDLKEENKEKDNDNKEMLKDGPKKSQEKIEEGTLSSAFCQNRILFYITLKSYFYSLVVSNCVSKKIKKQK